MTNSASEEASSCALNHDFLRQMEKINGVPWRTKLLRRAVKRVRKAVFTKRVQKQEPAHVPAREFQKIFSERFTALRMEDRDPVVCERFRETPSEEQTALQASTPCSKKLKDKMSWIKYFLTQSLTSESASEYFPTPERLNEDQKKFFETYKFCTTTNNVKETSGTITTLMDFKKTRV